MWKRWGKLVTKYTIVAIAVVVVLVSVVSVIWVWWVMLGLLIVSSLCDFAVSRFGRKQRKCEDSVTAATWTVQRSEIRRRPIRYWVWTIGLFVLLLYALLNPEAEVFLSESSSVSFRLLWPALIVFAWSCPILFVEAIAWRDFGATYFLFDSAFSPGGKIAGRIHFQRESPIKYDLISRVECFRHLTVQGEVDTTTLWVSERKIPSREFGTGPTGRRYIPIDFDLPSSALESSDVKGERIVWELSVRHVEPWPRRSEGRLRVPYEDRFQIPVVGVQRPSVS